MVYWETGQDRLYKRVGGIVPTYLFFSNRNQINQLNYYVI